MIYCNAQFIHFGDKGTPGYTAYILLHRSLAVLSIILLFWQLVVKEFAIQNFIAPNLVYLHNLDMKKWYKCPVSFKPFFKSL